MATTKAANGARTAKTIVDEAATSFEAATANGAHAVKENMERALAAASEMNAFGKENFEAWVASSTAATKGLEAISARAMAYSKSALEAHMSATKSIMTSKSVQELVEKQSEYARSAFDGYVAEVASLMRVSKMTVYRLVHNGELPAVRVGRSFRVHAKAVHDLLGAPVVRRHGPLAVRMLSLVRPAGTAARPSPAR